MSHNDWMSIYRGFMVVYCVCSWIFIIPDVMTLFINQFELQIIASLRISIIGLDYLVLIIYVLYNNWVKKRTLDLESDNYNRKLMNFMILSMFIFYSMSVVLLIFLRFFTIDSKIFSLNVSFFLLMSFSSIVISSVLPLIK